MRLKKISVIIEREMKARIFKKSFIIMTVLGPLLMGLVSIVPAYLTTHQKEPKKTIYIIDETGLFGDHFGNKIGEFSYLYQEGKLPPMIIEQLQENYHAVLVLTENFFKNQKSLIYSNHELSKTDFYLLKTELKEVYQNLLLIQCCTKSDQHVIENIRFTIASNNRNNNFKNDNNAIKTSISLLLGILVYFFILFYGMQVMRSVIEEKSNRIVEILVTSVKPFELMLGKIIGVAMVSLIQFLIWMGLVSAIFLYGSKRYSTALELFSNENIDQTINRTPDVEMALDMNQFLNELFSLNIPLMLVGFILFFLLGYLLYASVFAAIGAASDQETDVQQFVIPVTLPLFLCFTLIFNVIENPHSDLAYFLSLFPFTAPVIMCVRMPFIETFNQLLLPFSSMAITFFIIVWLAGRIYRTGILMYGKNTGYKDLWNWMKSKV